ncbi:CHAD domain-containing protein [bacterium]|nr:MAG: CHAD domain-containing protein [bacterium]
MADIGKDAGLIREESALSGASKLFTYLWDEAWEQAEATGNGDANALHDMRVALRRLRTALQNFEGDKKSPVLSAPLRRELKEWRDEIGKLGDRLGAVRDFDVLSDYVHDFDKEHSPGLEEFEVILKDEREHNFVPMARKIERCGQQGKLHESFARWSLGLPGAFSAADLSLDEVAHTLLPARVQEALAHGSALTGGDDEAQHELRKSLRRVRYTLETFSTCFDRSIKKPVKQLVELQDSLGEMQDRTVLSDWLDKSFKHAPEDVQAFAEHGEKRRQKLLEDVRELWKKRIDEGLWENLNKMVPSK